MNPISLDANHSNSSYFDVEPRSEEAVNPKSKPWHKRTVSWLKEHSKTIAIITGVSLLILAAIAGITALTIAFPYVMVPILILGVGSGALIVVFFAAFAAGGH